MKKRGFKSEKGEPMSVTQMVVERSTFQLLASIVGPFAVIHTAVDQSSKFFKKINKFKKWGPSVVGLSLIPILPMILDEPVEHGLEWAFGNYGPWAKSGGHKKKLD